jgi:hypothetical protein
MSNASQFIKSLLSVAAVVVSVLPVRADTHQLISGDDHITVSEAGGLSLFNKEFHTATSAMPLQAELVDASGAAVWYTGRYTAIRESSEGIEAVGTLQTSGGSVLQFQDQYRATAAGIEVHRTAEITRVGQGETGFSTRFALKTDWALPVSELLVPGVIYHQNQAAPKTAMGNHLEDPVTLIREDRTAVPLISIWHQRYGEWLELTRVDGSADTIDHEDGLARLIRPEFKFGSVGILNDGTLSAVFQYPGTEGERTYVFGGSEKGGRYALRSHPVTVGFKQQYTLKIRARNCKLYADMVADSAESAFKSFAPKTPDTNLLVAQKASINMLQKLCKKYRGAVSLPFAVHVPGGDPYDTSCQMGFVGDALPAADLLIRESLRSKDASLRANAVSLIDFWVHNSKTRSGVLKTWFDIQPDGKVTWRNDPQFLRVASDGLTGVLHAYLRLKSAGEDNADWMQYVRDWADWLLTTQNPDGSFFRTYALDGTPQDRRKDTTIQPVNLLVELAMATGNRQYSAAAKRAGAFCLKSAHEPGNYVGGTPDNPNTPDKEACILSAGGFLSLYDLDHDQQWLDAAERAAWFAETWVYLRNISLPTSDPENIYPASRSTAGLSIIALGHSGSDNFMAAVPFLWYRLSLLTHKKHFLDFAQFIQRACCQMMDLDGSLHYAMPGLLTEAMTLGPLRGHGVKSWLPWLTVTIAEPMAQLTDVFGDIDLQLLSAANASVMIQKNNLYGKLHTYH